MSRFTTNLGDNMLYKSFTIEELKSIAEKHTNVIIKESESGTLLFTQHGARLLGLFPDRNASNVLWVNENLDKNIDEHHAHIGGERLWISPERNFYYENPRDFEGYRIPFEIDPGEYRLLFENDTISFENNFSLLEYDQNKLFDNSQAKRKFTIIKDPYDTNFSYAGVSITDSMSINDPNIEMCAWSLAQVYTCGIESPGTAFFPANSKCDLISYFDPISTDRATSHGDYISFKIDGYFSSKVGIRPEDINFDIPCKAAYLSPGPLQNDLWFCTLKRSNDIPKSQNDCVDMTKNDSQNSKCAIEAFNTDHGSIEPQSFPCGEISLQFNKGIEKNGHTISKASHELLAYCGNKDEMIDLVKTVLKIETMPELF